MRHLPLVQPTPSQAAHQFVRKELASLVPFGDLLKQPMTARWNFSCALFVPLSLGLMATGCSLTPRSAPPYQIGFANSDLRKTSDCILAGIKENMSDPTITTSVNEKKAGKVEEITGISAGAGELYVIRLTAETDGTKAEAFSVLSWAKFKESDLQKPLSNCVAHLESGNHGRGSFRRDSETRNGD